MSDSFEHNKNDHEDPLPGPTWMIGFISAVLLIVVVFGVTSLFYRSNEQEGATKIDLVEKDPKQKAKLDLVRLEQKQLKVIHDPARIVKSMAGTQLVEERIVIPIDDAMKLVAEEYGR